MKNILFCTVLAAMYTITSASGGEEGDEKKIQGNWQIQLVSYADKDYPLNDKTKSVDIEFTKHSGVEVRASLVVTIKKKTITFGDNGTAPYKIDPTKKPKHLDLQERQSKGEWIYQLDSDTLKLGYTPAEKGYGPRPAVFDKKTLTMTFTRKKNADDAEQGNN